MQKELKKSEKKRNYSEKKGAGIFLSSVLLIIVLFFLTSGCRSEKTKAKSLMKKADAYFPLIIKESNQVENKVSELLNELGNQLRAGKTPDPQWFTNSVDSIYPLMETLTNEAKKAKTTYEKIMKMGDVEDYKKYAEIQIDIIDLNLLTVSELEDLLKVTQREISAGQFNPQAFGGKLTDLGERIEKRSDKIEDWENEANDLKKEKKL